MKQKRILLPLFFRYYLFDYYQNIVRELIARGHEVDFYYMYDNVKKEYEVFEGKGLRFYKLPQLLRIAQNRSGSLFFRILLWVFGWIWALWIRNRYHIVLVPWDNKPIWYILARVIPSVTNDVVTNMISLKVRTTADKFNRVEGFWDIPINIIEKLFRANIKPRLLNKVMKYNAKLSLVDWLMGKRALNNCLGFGSASIVTVTGSKIKENYCISGLNENMVFTVGNPGYDHIVEFAQSFKQSDKEDYLESLGIKSKKVVTLFLSPSNYSDEQILEIQKVIRLVNLNIEDCCFIVKFHPKTVKGDHERVLGDLFNEGIKIKEIRSFSGDIENAQIMLSSDFIVQKQCTLGFLAMVLKIPMISYNLVTTEYEDDMYKHLSASFHCETEEELNEALSKILSDDDLKLLKQKQSDACQKFCLATSNSSGLVVDIIEKDLGV